MSRLGWYRKIAQFRRRRGHIHQRPRGFRRPRGGPIHRLVVGGTDHKKHPHDMRRRERLGDPANHTFPRQVYNFRQRLRRDDRHDGPRRHESLGSAQRNMAAAHDGAAAAA